LPTLALIDGFFEWKHKAFQSAPDRIRQISKN